MVQDLAQANSGSMLREEQSRQRNQHSGRCRIAVVSRKLGRRIWESVGGVSGRQLGRFGAAEAGLLVRSLLLPHFYIAQSVKGSGERSVMAHSKGSTGTMGCACAELHAGQQYPPRTKTVSTHITGVVSARSAFRS